MSDFMKTSGLYRLMDEARQAEMERQLDQTAAVRRIVQEIPDAGRLIGRRKQTFTNTLSPDFASRDEGDSDTTAPTMGMVVGGYRMICDISRRRDGMLWLCKEANADGPAMVMRVFDLDRDSAADRHRFVGESGLLSRLPDHCSGRVVDSGILDDGLAFRVSRLAPGVPVNEFCDLNSVSVPERFLIARQLCRSVSRLHEAGVVGLNYAESDILVSQAGSDPIVTLVDVMVEAHQGRTRESLIQADVRRLGLFMMALITGLSSANCETEAKRSRPRPMSEILRHQCFALPMIARRRQATADNISQIVPPPADQLVSRCFASTPQERFADVAELADALEKMTSAQQSLRT